jgi:hypothetical protein
MDFSLYNLVMNLSPRSISHWNDDTFSVSKYLSSLTFSYNFDHSSYSKNYVNTIYFVCDMLYYYRYFKHDLTFCTFAINF